MVGPTRLHSRTTVSSTFGVAARGATTSKPGDYRPRCSLRTLVKALGEQDKGTSVLQVACGATHTLALCDNGDVYSWGSNEEVLAGPRSSAGRKVSRPELVAGKLSGWGVLRVAATKPA